MPTTDSVFQNAMRKILTEIFDGPPGKDAFLLNPGDPGMLGQLESIDATTASSRPMAGLTTVASHVDHVHYGVTLMNRWIAGEPNPWASADWTASWKRTTVTEEQWRTLRDNLRKETDKWRRAIETHSDWNEMSAPGAISSAAHTAYHLGAIRQILAAMNKNNTPK
jgi:hypothetical protein